MNQFLYKILTRTPPVKGRAAPKSHEIYFILYTMAGGHLNQGKVNKTGLIEAYILVSHGQVVSVQHIQYNCTVHKQQQQQFY